MAHRGEGTRAAGNPHAVRVGRRRILLRFGRKHRLQALLRPHACGRRTHDFRHQRAELYRLLRAGFKRGQGYLLYHLFPQTFGDV